jgi:hypothetical protein
MQPSPSNKAAKRATATAQQELLDSLVGIVSKHAKEQIVAMTNRVVAAFLDVSSAGLDARTVFQRVKAGNLLKTNSYAYFHIAVTTLEKALRKEMLELAPVGQKSVKAAPSALSLVPFEEMDSKVTLGGISRAFEVEHSEALATLNVRLGFLLERDVLRMNQNPFRPEVFLMAFSDAWCEFEPELENHQLIQPLLKPEILFDLAPLYEELNQSLMRKGVLPGSVDSLRIKKTDSAAAAKAKRATTQAALQKQLREFLSGEGPAPEAMNEFGIDIPMIPDLPSLPQGTGGWRPSGAQAFGASAPAPAPAPAVHAAPGGFPSLSGIQIQAPAAGYPAAQGGYPAPAQGGYPAPAQGGYPAPAQGGAPWQGQAQMPGGGAPMIAAPGMMQPAGGGQPMSAGSNQPLLDFIAQIQQNMPAMQPGAGFGAMQGGGAPAGPGVSLPPNVFYLPRLKESMPAGSLTRGAESTIDLLSRIFETVSLDDNIPRETRELIQFLQIPVLKAALVDKDFFFEEAHPARRMIDLMSRMGVEQSKGADDPLFKAMQRSVDRVGRDASQELGVFAEAVAELEASIQAEESVAAAAIQEPIAQALKQEKRTAATRSARNAVAIRVGKGEVIAIVETFLEKKWTSVLTVAYQVEEDKPGAVGNATKTMDDLIWSVKPKVTAQQRKELIGKLPGLLVTLNRWLDVIKWQDAERLQFFAELAECHASIVRAPIELSPDRQLEIAVEVAQQDAIRRIEKEQALAAQEEAAIDDAVLAVEALERGSWYEFTMEDASVRKVKLAWISPLKTLYIFSTGARQEAFSLSSEKLAETFRNGKVRSLQVDGVVSRALTEAMEKVGAVNDPSMDLHPAVA